MKQYHILKATKAGDPWTSSHGSSLQSYFLNVEGVDRDTVVMCNRKPDSPAPMGVVWAEAEEGTTKNGKAKLTLRLKPAPDGAQSYSKPAQTSFGASAPSSGISWGESIQAAAMCAPIAKGEGVKPEDVLEWAQFFYESKPKDLDAADQLKAEMDAKKDVVLEDLDDSPVNLDDIPF